MVVGRVCIWKIGDRSCVVKHVVTHFVLQSEGSLRALKYPLGAHSSTSSVVFTIALYESFIKSIGMTSTAHVFTIRNLINSLKLQTIKHFYLSVFNLILIAGESWDLLMRWIDLAEYLISVSQVFVVLWLHNCAVLRFRLNFNRSWSATHLLWLAIDRLLVAREKTRLHLLVRDWWAHSHLVQWILWTLGGIFVKRVF